jgi:acyl-homoserine lactone acylase PvdQ
VKSLEEFKNNLDLKANLSNNTVYADAAGNIAYWHGNYMPIRDTAYNWEIPVHGSISKTEWKGLHDIEQTVHIINPANGWIQNTNNTPYSVSGEMSPARKNYPGYMAPDGENFRGINAVRLLSARQKFSMDDLIAVGYDPHLSAFDTSVPILISAHEKLKTTNPGLYNEMAEPIAALKTWDRNSGVNSVPTTLAIHWAEKMNAVLRSEDPELFADYTARYGSVLRNTDPVKLLQPLKEVTDTLIAHFGKWQVPWGEINRMQRIANSITPVHSDTAPSIPVGRAASTWGQLGSLVSRYVSGSHKRYATGGNSFVCVVEFGKRITARSILAGGQSGDPGSPHFFDQAGMYAEGKFKEVHFYKEDVLKNAKRTYRPGRF